MKEFNIGQYCATKSKSGKVYKGFVKSDEIVKKKKLDYILVDVDGEDHLFPLHKTLIVVGEY